MRFTLIMILLAAAVTHAVGTETDRSDTRIGAVAVTAACAEAGRSAPSTGTIVVTAVGIRTNQGGSVIFALCKGKANWLDVDKSFLKKMMKATSDSIAVRFEGVPYDSSYAIEVIHDKNENGKLDMRTFPYPKPKEGAGVSHNTFRLGPPDYDKARFAVSDSLISIRVVIRY
jgi:uncharacterized protein (DUF2141 family)